MGQSSFAANEFDTVVPMDSLSLSLEQKMLRMTGMSATDIVRLSGLAPPCMGGAISVYCDKIGEPLNADDEMSEDLERGIFAEPFLRNWYAHRTGRSVDLPGTLQSKEHPLIFASPDGISYEPSNRMETQRVLEIKAPRNGFAWDEDDAPPYYRIQNQVQMGVSGVHYGDVVAMINGQLRIYPQVFDPALYASVVGMAYSFWHNHVVPRVSPPPDATEAYSDWLARRHPTNLDDHMVEADATALAWAVQYRAASQDEKDAVMRKREARNHLVAAIGDHMGLVDADGNKLATYKKSKDSDVVDYRALAANADPETINRFRCTKSGNRSIKVY